MQIFSENTQIFAKKVITDTFGSYVRAFLVSTLLVILGAVAGLFVSASTIDPRVSAQEVKLTKLQGDFTTAYTQVQAQLKALEDSKLETQVQVQMLILYQIPTAERDRLRTEAEAQLDKKAAEDSNTP